MSKRYLKEGFQDRPYVESAADILKLLYQEMRDLDQEVFKVVLLNGQNHVFGSSDAARGTLTAAKIYPREVVKLALRHSAAAVVFVHNHPSGVAEPSPADHWITDQLKAALSLVDVKVLDHFIIAGSQALYSFAEHGLM